MGTRTEAFAAIDSERDYQDRVFSLTASSGKSGGGMLDRTIDEFSLYIMGQSQELVRIASAGGTADQKLELMRKVAALAVACMEAHGVKGR
jgi:hypothetical protein